jgi:hypothetical protein
MNSSGALARGSLASVVNNQMDQIVNFQYNPESIKRSLSPQVTAGQAPDHSSEVRFTDAPQQKITFTAYFDAADALAAGDATALSKGIAPQLATLERIIYPTRKQVEDRDKDRDQGVMEVAPLLAPSLILVWGPNRTLPVRVTQVDITEDAFDANLNPIRATVALTIAVQTYGDRTPDDDDYRRFGAYHQALENLSQAATRPS